MRALTLLQQIMETKVHDFDMILLGDVGVGKTTLFVYLQTGKPLDDETRLTMGVDIAYKTATINGHEVTVSLISFFSNCLTQSLPPTYMLSNIV